MFSKKAPGDIPLTEGREHVFQQCTAIADGYAKISFNFRSASYAIDKRVKPTHKTMITTDNKEELLKIVLAHEFSRCVGSFNLFADLMSTLPKHETKKRRLECYNAYVDFLSHLYEFYRGLITRDAKFNQLGFYKDYAPFKGLVKRSDDHTKFDIIFTEEVEKILRNRKQRILRGIEDNIAGNRAEFYECKVPTEFGKHFRFVRNRTSHTDFKRASSKYDLSLTDFFLNYHKYVLILFDECRWLWQVDENQFDWKDIDTFASEIMR